MMNAPLLLRRFKGAAYRAWICEDCEQSIPLDEMRHPARAVARAVPAARLIPAPRER